MGVQKASSSKSSAKTTKKNSRFETLKTLVFGGGAEGSHSAKKQGRAVSKGALPSSARKKASLTKAAQTKAILAPAGKARKAAVAPALAAKDRSKAVPHKPDDKVMSKKAEKARTAGPGQVPSKKSGGSPRGAEGRLTKGSSTKNLGSTMVLEAGETVCREVACEGLATSGGYCRLHYIKNWRKIKRKEVILREKKLNQYIEELVAKYPDKYIEAIRQDLANDKDFAKVIYDLDLDETVDDFDVEGGETVDSLIDTIKRDFDDEGEY